MQLRLELLVGNSNIYNMYACACSQLCFDNWGPTQPDKAGPNKGLEFSMLVQWSQGRKKEANEKRAMFRKVNCGMHVDLKDVKRHQGINGQWKVCMFSTTKVLVDKTLTFGSWRKSTEKGRRKKNPYRTGCWWRKEDIGQFQWNIDWRERRVKKDTQHTRGTGFPAPPSHLIQLGCSVPKEFEAKQGRTELFHHIEVRP